MISKNLKWLVFSLTISVTVIVIILTKTVTKESFTYLSNIDYFILVIAILAHFSFFLMWGVRIKIMSHSMGQTIKYKSCLKIVFVNTFAATITPANVGGEPVRIKMLTDLNFSGGDATALVVTERVLDAIFLLSIAPILFLFFSENQKITIFYYLFGAILVLLALIITFLVLILKYRYILKNVHKVDRLFRIFIKSEQRRKGIIKMLRHEYKNFYNSIMFLFVNHKRNFVGIFLVTAAMWLSDFLIFSILLLSFHQNPIWIFSLFAQVVIVLVSILPITPGGSGLVEFVAFALYSEFVNFSLLGILILIWRLIVFYFNIALGFAFTTHYIFNTKKPKNSL